MKKSIHRLTNIILGSAIAIMLIMASCDTPTYINPQEYLDQEQALLNEFYNSIQEDGQTWLDSMTSVTVDTIDHRNESGMMMFHTKVGTGDSVKVFKSVGFRYTQYQILRDTVDLPGMYAAASNDYALSPQVYTTFLLTDANSSYATSIPQGVNEAILNMRYGGECRVVVPSTINSNSNYITTIWDLRVTYLED